MIAEPRNLNTSSLAGLIDCVGAVDLDRLAINVDVEFIAEGLRGAEIYSAQKACEHAE